MRRIGVMGGTFDPVHHGHLVAASEVAHDFTLDEVIFVPTGEPYQKDHRQVSPAEDRYLMTAIATAPNWFKPHWALAQLLEQTHRHDEALTEARFAVDLDGGRDAEVSETWRKLQQSSYPQH